MCRDLPYEAAGKSKKVVENGHNQELPHMHLHRENMYFALYLYFLA
jgi:hypothetical protein